MIIVVYQTGKPILVKPSMALATITARELEFHYDLVFRLTDTSYYEHPILNKEARNTNLKKVVRIKVSGYYLENSNRPTLIALYKTNSK